jgi:hypothetical protein
MCSVSVSVQLEVFWSGNKEYRLHNQEMDRKVVFSNTQYSFITLLLSFVHSDMTNYIRVNPTLMCLYVYQATDTVTSIAVANGQIHCLTLYYTVTTLTLLTFLLWLC